MNLHLLILSCLLYTSYTAPLPNSATSCASQCVEPTKFGLQVGKTYTYGYAADTTSTIEGIDSDQSGLHLRAKVHLTARTTCELQLTLTDVTALTTDAADVSSQSEMWVGRQVKESLEEYPLMFAFQDGAVGSVCPNPEEQRMALNIKRSIISAFQNRMSHFYNNDAMIERDINGDCPTTYALKPSKGDDLVFNRTKELAACKDRSQVYSWVQATPYFNPAGKYQSFPIVDSKHSCEQTFSVSKKHLTKVYCKERNLLKPFSKGNNGITTTSMLDITFETMTDAAAAAENNAPFEVRNIAFEHGDDQLSAQALDAPDALTAACKDPTIKPETPAMFGKLVADLKTATVDDLMTVKETADGCKFSKQLFYDALVLVQTEASVSFMAKLLPDVAKPVAMDWLNSLPFIEYPTENMLNDALVMLKISETCTTRRLTVSSLMHNFCRAKPMSCQDDTLPKAIRETIEILSAQVGDCNPDAADAESLRKVEVALKALGNIGYGLRSNLKVQQMCMKQKSPISVRLATLDSVRRIPCSDDYSDLQSKLFDIADDASLETEIRVKAYAEGMRCLNDDNVEQLVEVVQNILSEEKTNQVGSYIYSHLWNLRKPNRSPFRRAYSMLLDDVVIQRVMKLDPTRFSRNFVKSNVNDAMNMGATMEGNMIFDEQSFVPRSANANFTVDLFGHSVNFLEIGGRVEGIQDQLESLWGPGGLLAKPNNKRKRAPRNVDNAVAELDNEYDYKPRPIAASMYMRVFGNEIMTVDMQDVMKSFAARQQQFASLLVDLTQNMDIDWTKNAELRNTAIQMPTVIGLPMTVRVNASASIRIKATGAADLSRARESPPSMSLKYDMAPSASVEVYTEMYVELARSRSGVLLKSNMFSNYSENGAMELNDGETMTFTSDCGDHSILFSTSNQVFIRVPGPDNALVPQLAPNAERFSEEQCSGTFMEVVMDLQVCVKRDYALPTATSPMPVLIGPNSFAITMSKTKRNLGYKIESSRTYDEAAGTMEGQMKLLVLGADRMAEIEDTRFSAKYSKSPKHSSLALTTPWKEMNFNSDFQQADGTRQLKIKATSAGTSYLDFSATHATTDDTTKCNMALRDVFSEDVTFNSKYVRGDDRSFEVMLKAPSLEMESKTSYSRGQTIKFKTEKKMTLSGRTETAMFEAEVVKKPTEAGVYVWDSTANFENSVYPKYNMKMKVNRNCDLRGQIKNTDSKFEVSFNGGAPYKLQLRGQGERPSPDWSTARMNMTVVMDRQGDVNQVDMKFAHDRASRWLSTDMAVYAGEKTPIKEPMFAMKHEIRMQRRPTPHFVLKGGYQYGGKDRSLRMEFRRPSARNVDFIVEAKPSGNPKDTHSLGLSMIRNYEDRTVKLGYSYQMPSLCPPNTLCYRIPPKAMVDMRFSSMGNWKVNLDFVASPTQNKTFELSHLCTGMDTPRFTATTVAKHNLFGRMSFLEFLVTKEPMRMEMSLADKVRSKQLVLLTATSDAASMSEPEVNAQVDIKFDLPLPIKTIGITHNHKYEIDETGKYSCDMKMGLTVNNKKIMITGEGTSEKNPFSIMTGKVTYDYLGTKDKVEGTFRFEHDWMKRMILNATATPMGRSLSAAGGPVSVNAGVLLGPTASWSEGDFTITTGLKAFKKMMYKWRRHMWEDEGLYRTTMSEYFVLNDMWRDMKHEGTYDATKKSLTFESVQTTSEGSDHTMTGDLTWRMPLKGGFNYKGKAAEIGMEMHLEPYIQKMLMTTSLKGYEKMGFTNEITETKPKYEMETNVFIFYNKKLTLTADLMVDEDVTTGSWKVVTPFPNYELATGDVELTPLTKPNGKLVVNADLNGKTALFELSLGTVKIETPFETFKRLDIKYVPEGSKHMTTLEIEGLKRKIEVEAELDMGTAKKFKVDIKAPFKNFKTFDALVSMTIVENIHNFELTIGYNKKNLVDVQADVAWGKSLVIRSTAPKEGVVVLSYSKMGDKKMAHVSIDWKRDFFNSTIEAVNIYNDNLYLRDVNISFANNDQDVTYFSKSEFDPINRYNSLYSFGAMWAKTSKSIGIKVNSKQLAPTGNAENYGCNITLINPFSDMGLQIHKSEDKTARRSTYNVRSNYKNKWVQLKTIMESMQNGAKLTSMDGKVVNELSASFLPSVIRKTNVLRIRPEADPTIWFEHNIALQLGPKTMEGGMKVFNSYTGKDGFNITVDHFIKGFTLDVKWVAHMARDRDQGKLASHGFTASYLDSENVMQNYHHLVVRTDENWETDVNTPGRKYNLLWTREPTADGYTWQMRHDYSGRIVERTFKVIKRDGFRHITYFYDPEDMTKSRNIVMRYTNATGFSTQIYTTGETDTPKVNMDFQLFMNNSRLVHSRLWFDADDLAAVQAKYNEIRSKADGKNERVRAMLNAEQSAKMKQVMADMQPMMKGLMVIHKKQMKELSDDALDMREKVMRIAWNNELFLKTIINSVEKFYNTIVKPRFGAMTNLIGSYGSNMAAYQQGVGQKWDRVMLSLRDVMTMKNFKKMMTAMKERLDRLNRFIQSLPDHPKLKKMIDGVKQFIQDARTYYSSQWEELKKAAQPQIEKLKENPILQEPVNKLIDMYNTLCEQINTMYKSYDVDGTTRNVWKEFQKNMREELKYMRFNYNVTYFNPSAWELQLDLYFPFKMRPVSEWRSQTLRDAIKRFRSYYENMKLRKAFQSPYARPIMKAGKPVDIFYRTGHATLFGGKHFMTFDHKHYDFKGTCTYLLARDFHKKNFTMTAKFNSEMKRESVAMYINKKKFEILKEGQVLIDGAKTELPWLMNNISVTRDAHIVRVHDMKSGLRMKCDIAYDACIFTVPVWYHGKTAGLFGTFDNEAYNDMMKPDGSLTEDVDEFAASWMVDGSCTHKGMPELPENPEMEETCKEHFGPGGPYSSCYGTLPPAEFEKMCRTETPIYGTYENECRAAAWYIHSCRAHGFRGLQNRCETCNTASRTLGTPTSNVSMGVVVVYEERASNPLQPEHVKMGLKLLSSKVEQSLQNEEGEAGRLQFGVVGFGSKTFDKPHVHTVDGKLWGGIEKVDGPINSLQADREQGSGSYKDIQRVLDFVLKTYDFSGSQRNAILLSLAGRCESGSLNYMSEKLKRRGITIHVMTPVDMSWKSGDSSMLFGVDMKSVISSASPGERDEYAARRDVEFEEDSCTRMALTNGGGVFSSKWALPDFSDVEDGQFVSAVVDKVVSYNPAAKKGKDCKCEYDKFGAPTGVCTIRRSWSSLIFGY